MLDKKTINYLQKNIKNDISGQTVIITGANSGVGFKAAEELIYLGCKIIMACRSEEKANKAKEELLKDYPTADIKVYPLDLASMDSIKKFAARVKRNKLDVYALVNNAGVYHIGDGKKKTQDGFELIMGTNYLGTYALVERLLPYFEALPHDVKVINTTSLTYKKGKINYKDFFNEKRYKHMKVYSASKLAITKYSIYLANKYMDSPVDVLLTHPGAAPTPLATNSVRPGIIKAFRPFLKLMQSVEKSALAIPYAVGTKLRDGTFMGPHGLFDMWGKPKKINLNKKAYQENAKLISFTEELLKNMNKDEADK